MSWFCSICQKSFSRKDSMQRHLMSTHRKGWSHLISNSANVFTEMSAVSLRASFHLRYRRNDLVRKNGLVRSLLQQASETIYPSPERILWCYSQWQLAYTEMLVAMPHIEFVKGIATALVQDVIMIAIFAEKYTVKDHVSNTKLEKGYHYYIQRRHKDLFSHHNLILRKL